MEKTFKFKLKDSSSHRRAEVTVETSFKPIIKDGKKTDSQLVFSANGYLKTKEIECWGQCLNEIADNIIKNPLFDKIYYLWKNHHLNDMHAGTERQEQALKDVGLNRADYTKQCEYLKSVNLYIDNNYRYGSKWLYRKIPEKDMAILQKVLDTNQN